MTALIVRWIAQGGYWGIAALMMLENVFPPIPSEVIMGLGGIAVAQGEMRLGWLLVAGTAGTLAGNWFWYWIGRRFGYDGLKPYMERWGRWLTIEWEDVERITRFFHTRGFWTVFVCRFMPTFRTMVSLPAGMARMPRWRFALATAGGAAVWNAALAGAGIALGARFDEVDRYLGPVAIAIMAAIVVAYGWRMATWRPRRR